MSRVIRGYVLMPDEEEVARICGKCSVCGEPDGLGLGYLHLDCQAKKHPPLTAQEKRRNQYEYKHKALASSIFERDGHRCVACGSLDNLTLDHIVPISKGGSDTEDNLQTLCKSCNSRKKDH